MAKDYKHRVQARKSPQRGQRDRRKGVALWRWALITALGISFVVFLVYLRKTAPKEADTHQSAATVPAVTPTNAEPNKDKTPKPEKSAGPKPPHFEFYNILPNKEVVVPEHEIKTRTREERVGKAKDSKYIMQAGSFKTAKEADQLRAKLALMGIQAKVDKAKIGSKTDKATVNSATWYRVKIGPYAKMTSVDIVKSRLKKQGIDVMVTEVNR